MTDPGGILSSELSATHTLSQSSDLIPFEGGIPSGPFVLSLAARQALIPLLTLGLQGWRLFFSLLRRALGESWPFSTSFSQTFHQVTVICGTYVASLLYLKTFNIHFGCVWWWGIRVPQCMYDQWAICRGCFHLLPYGSWGPTWVGIKWLYPLNYLSDLYHFISYSILSFKIYIPG